jgi:hypothetical protein
MQPDLTALLHIQIKKALEGISANKYKTRVTEILITLQKKVTATWSKCNSMINNERNGSYSVGVGSIKQTTSPRSKVNSLCKGSIRLQEWRRKRKS